MGISVLVDRRSIWSPSLVVGKLFFDQIQTIEQRLKLKSGVECVLDDELQIDPGLFSAFIGDILKVLADTNNRPLFALCSGCVQVCIALNAEITGQWPEVSGHLKPLAEGAKIIMLPIDV